MRYESSLAFSSAHAGFRFVGPHARHAQSERRQLSDPSRAALRCSSHSGPVVRLR